MLIKLLALKDTYLYREEGATAIEYALLAAGVSLAIIAIVFTFGDNLKAMFTNLNTKITATR